MSSGCHHKWSQARWLRTTKTYSLTFWRPEVQNHGAQGRVSAGDFGGEPFLDSSSFWWCLVYPGLCPHMAIFPGFLHLSAPSPFSSKETSLWVSSPPWIQHNLTWRSLITWAKTQFQRRWHLLVLGVRTWPYLLGATIQPTSGDNNIYWTVHCVWWVSCVISFNPCKPALTE